jgi:hypothetical protein
MGCYNIDLIYIVQVLSILVRCLQSVVRVFILQVIKLSELRIDIALSVLHWISCLNTIGHGNPDSNLESPYMLRNSSGHGP